MLIYRNGGPTMVHMMMVYNKKIEIVLFFKETIHRLVDEINSWKR